MKRSEIAGRIQQIGAMESVEEMRAAMLEFQQELETDYEDHESVTAERDNLLAVNKNLKDYNKKMWLATGKKGKPEEAEEEEKTENLKYEDLFDEKGGLK